MRPLPRHALALGLLAALIGATQPTTALALQWNEQLAACARIPEATPRLECYDALAARLDLEQAELATRPASAPGTPAAPAAPVEATATTMVAATAPPAAPPSPLETFGREQALLAEATVGENALAKIEAAIVGLRLTQAGSLVVELDNGQTWMQSEVARYPLPLTLGERVTIKRAALGSFQLVTRHSRSVRVRRVN